MKQEISPRQKQILYYLAREQVGNSEPVSSIQIKEKYDLEFSPATIRHELFELCQMDYLEQPHISAGRILSDIGWQILISDFLKNVFMEDILDPPDDLEELAKMLSNQTRALGIVYD
jgi:heat-inducible transcriptional repressor